MSAVLAEQVGLAPIVPLSEVADLVRGVSYPKADAREDPAAGFVPVLRATNIQDARLVLDSDLIFVAERNVSPHQLLREGDIVVATSSGSKHLVGKSGQLHAAWRGSFGAFCATVRPRPGIHPRYLALFLQTPSYWRQITQKAVGVNINNLRRGDLESLELPLPPLAAQESIVAEIEKQFSRLDEAVANLDRVRGDLRRFQRAVLAAAIDGSLVGVAPTNAVPISVAIETLDQGWSPQCEREAAVGTDEWAVIKTTAIQPMKYVDVENKRLPSTLQPRPNLELRASDLLLTRAGPRSRVGVACLVRRTRPRLMVCDKAYRIRVKAHVALPAYLEIALNAPAIADELNDMKTGISDSGVNLTQTRFGELRIPLPALDVQHQIVAEAERRFSLVGQIGAALEACRLRSEVLRQSVLAASFLYDSNVVRKERDYV